MYAETFMGQPAPQQRQKFFVRGIHQKKNVSITGIQLALHGLRQLSKRTLLQASKHHFDCYEHPSTISRVVVIMPSEPPSEEHRNPILAHHITTSCL
jgi:hypothetical protein